MGVGVEAVQDFAEPSPKHKTGTECKIIIATARRASMKSCLGEKSVYVREQVLKFSRDGCCRAVQVIRQAQRGKKN